jgi:DNA-binding NarL/FixJ family response regulator
MMNTRSRLAQTKFIVITGHQSPELLEAAIQAGADAFLLKPYDFSELSTTVVKVQAGRRSLGSTAAIFVWDRFATDSRQELSKKLRCPPTGNRAADCAGILHEGSCGVSGYRRSNSRKTS